MTDDNSLEWLRHALDLVDVERLDAAQSERMLVIATHQGWLSKAAQSLADLGPGAIDEPARLQAQAAWSLCREIERVTRQEQEHMLAVLQTKGIEASIDDLNSMEGLQFHRFELRLPEADVAASLEIAEREGYLRWQPWRRGALKAFMKWHASTTVVKQDALAMRMALRWRPVPGRSSWSARLKPSNDDLSSIELPSPLWPAYTVIHFLRALLQKLTHRQSQLHLGPFLGTPSMLMPRLLDFADVTEADVLLDLGCGDGRVVIEAAHSCGCRTIGIEQDPSLVALARRNVREHGLDDRVRIEQGDAASWDTTDATVVFLFLPPPAIRSLLPVLLHRLEPGARIVAHEQLSLGDTPEPSRTALILGKGALTVARLWVVS